MSKNIDIWAAPLAGGAPVNKDKPISRGTATYRAYHKLGLLNKYASEYEVAGKFDEAYGELGKYTDCGDMYIPIPLTREFGIFELYHRFREVHPALAELHPIWSQYDFDDFNIQIQGDKTEARCMLTGNGDVDGLYFTSKIVEKQVEEADALKVKFEAEHPGLALKDMDPAAYIALTAIRLELGEKPVDFTTYTRFIGFTPKEVEGKFFVPLARWYGDAMRLGWSSITSTFGDCGARFIIQKK